jgi:hypothetical protein
MNPHNHLDNCWCLFLFLITTGIVVNTSDLVQQWPFKNDIFLWQNIEIASLRSLGPIFPMLL